MNLKKLTGSREFINGIDRYCLWIDDIDLDFAKSIPEVGERIRRVRESRLKGGTTARSCADRPHQFCLRNQARESLIVIPAVSSERRKYIPMGFLGSDTIITNLAYAIYDPEPYLFGVLNSSMHMAWMRLLAGRLKSDYRYSTGVNYNTFPIPPISDIKKAEIQALVRRILFARENHSEKTLAELYDPDKMPSDLGEAHNELDVAIDRLYRLKPYNNDEERLADLLMLYGQMLAEEERTK